MCPCIPPLSLGSTQSQLPPVPVVSDGPTICCQLADAAKLKPLEMQLKKLEDLSEAIVQNFAYMREREEQMRDTNGEH